MIRIVQARPLGDVRHGVLSGSLHGLLITPNEPKQVGSGAEQRTYHLLTSLQAIALVDVVVLQPAAGRSVEVIKAGDQVFLRATAVDSGNHLRFRPSRELTAALEIALGRSLQTYSFIVGRYLWGVTQIIVPRQVPLIADLDDFKYRFDGKLGVRWSTLVMRLRKALGHRVARAQLPRLSAAFFASDRDRLEHPEIRAETLVNVPASGSKVPATEVTGDRIIFVGSLWYPPNREAVEWFLTEVWGPLVHRRPRATLRLIGSAPEEVRARWRRWPRVSADGFTEDLAEEYAKASVVVAPIHSGGGSNIKIVEALAHGRPCVATTFCHAAFAEKLRPEIDLLVASSAKDFLEKVVALLDNPERSQAIARSGHAAVHQHFTRVEFQSTVTKLVSSVLASSRP